MHSGGSGFVYGCVHVCHAGAQPLNNQVSVMCVHQKYPTRIDVLYESVVCKYISALLLCQHYGHLV